MSKLDLVTEPKIRAIITGSATPAIDIQGLWPQLSEREQWQALAYFRSTSSLLDHANAELNFCIDNDI